MKRRCLLLLTFLLLTWPFLANNVMANVTLGISPLKFERELNPGGNSTDSVQVSNPGSVPLHVTTQVTDYTINLNGVPVFDNPANNPISAGNWLKANPSEFDIKPGESKTVNLQVQVPMDASPGGHYGAVLFQFGGGTTPNTGLGVSGRIAVVDLITVPGAMKKQGFIQNINIPTLSAGYPVPISVHIANTGNVHLLVKGKLVLKNLLGGQESLEIAPGYVFPNSVKEFKLELSKGSMFGFYQAKLAIDEPALKNINPVYFVVFPWSLVLGLILAAYGIYKLGNLRGRREKKNPE